MDCVFSENMGLEFPNAATYSELSQNMQSALPKNEIKNESESESESEPESEYSERYLTKIENLEWCMKNIENRQRELEDRVDNHSIGLVIVIGIVVCIAGFVFQPAG